MTMQPILETKEAGVTYRTAQLHTLRVVGDRITPVIDGGLGATRFEVFDVTGPEGSGPPPHSHPWDESYYVLEGKLGVVDWTGGLERPSETVLDAGGSAFVAGGTTHSFVAKTATCRFMIVASPGAHGFFSDADTTLGDRTDDLLALVAVAKRNGLKSPLFPD